VNRNTTRLPVLARALRLGSLRCDLHAPRASSRALLCAAALALLAPFSPARAEEKAKAKKVLRLEEFTVEGRIQKPQAFFILQRSNLSFDGAEKKESFLPKIQKSCEKDPF
jgi:hypothetical protein